MYHKCGVRMVAGKPARGARWIVPAGYRLVGCGEPR
jgi:hypothetical protein